MYSFQHKKEIYHITRDKIGTRLHVCHGYAQHLASDRPISHFAQEYALT